MAAPSPFSPAYFPRIFFSLNALESGIFHLQARPGGQSPGGEKAILVLKNLLLWLSLVVSVWAQQAVEIPLVPNAAPVKLTLPEGYSLRAVDGMEGNWIFCPWNEYFNVSTSRFKQSSTLPIKDEAAMKAELLAFTQANQSMQFQVQQVVMTPKGPYGWLESANSKGQVACSLLVPHKGELLAFSMVGSTSSLADQKVIRDLFVKEVSK